MPAAKYKKGDVINGWKLIEKISNKSKPNRFDWKVKCPYCKKEFEKTLERCRSCRSCGCAQRKLLSEVKRKDYSKYFGKILKDYKVVGKGKDYVAPSTGAKISTVVIESLITGERKTRRASTLENGYNFSSIKYPNDPERVSFNSLYKSIQRSAEARGYSFNISAKKFKEISKQNCYYCNAIPRQIHKAHNSHYVYNGLDRVDNRYGYSVKNCVPCCGTCNIMKNTLGYQEFLDHIEKISKHQKRKKTK